MESVWYNLINQSVDLSCVIPYSLVSLNDFGCVQSMNLGSVALEAWRREVSAVQCSSIFQQTFFFSVLQEIFFPLLAHLIVLMANGNKLSLFFKRKHAFSPRFAWRPASDVVTPNKNMLFIESQSVIRGGRVHEKTISLYVLWVILTGVYLGFFQGGDARLHFKNTE